jgi:hypothetical protein
MAKPNPLWRKAFDAVERPLRDRVETVAGTQEFGRALMLAFGAWTTVGRTARGASTYLLHLGNLPAHADLRRLARQLGALENKVDKLTADLERIEGLLERSPGERARRAAK